MSHPLDKYFSPRGIEHRLIGDEEEVELSIIIPFNRSAVPEYHPLREDWMNLLDLTTALDELYELFEKYHSTSHNSDSSDPEVEP